MWNLTTTESEIFVVVAYNTFCSTVYARGLCDNLGILTA